MTFGPVDLLVVGAGFYGATVAERLAGRGRRICVIDRRPHVGGNAYSAIDDATGIEKHVYGAHVFHTSNRTVWTYLQRFCAFNTYRHRVLTTHRGRAYPMPINLGTLCQFFERCLSPQEARALVRSQTEGLDPTTVRNLEDKAIASVGRPIYEAFIKEYTIKQWQTDPRELPPETIGRLPVRFTFDDRYFNDAFEGIPLDGYARLFDTMFSHPNIALRLSTDFFDLCGSLAGDQKIVFTGPIDKFYDYSEGQLRWRTTDFAWDRPQVGDFQGTSVMNYADRSDPWTRIIEFRHFHPERDYPNDRTLIAREYSRGAGPQDEPFYPIATPSDREIYRRYQQRAATEVSVRFGGRLGTYKYLDMHQAIAAALNDVDAIDAWIGSGKDAAAHTSHLPHMTS